MFNRIRVYISRAVMRASVRGNPLARRMNARATRAYIASLPPQSPLVPGPFEVPDFTRPLPETVANRLLGDYALVALPHRKVRAEALPGRQVTGIETQIGSYGMGGFGFVGIALEDEWLIVPLHSAAQWIAVDGRLIEDPDHEAGRRRPPWLPNGAAALAGRIGGHRIASARIARHAMTLRLENGARIEIHDDPSARPVQAQSGQPRAFVASDDLTAALFLSPTPVIYGFG